MRLILAGCALVAVMAGTAAAEPRNASGFTRVHASAATNVEVTVGQGFSVDVSGPGADRVITRVSGQTLIVERPRGFHFGPAPRALVRVSMPRADGLEASSAAELTATGVNGGNLALGASSAGTLRVSGRCATFEADSSSGGDLRAQDLHCENGNVEASSGGGARVFASGRLNVDASSGGHVIAYGNSNIGNVDLSSGGTLRRAE